MDLRGDVTGGVFYMNMTGLSSLTGTPDQAWYKMDLKSMFDQMKRRHRHEYAALWSSVPPAPSRASSRLWLTF